MDEVLSRIEKHLEDGGGTFRGWVKAPYAELRMPAQERSLWSPRLAICTDELSEGVSLCCRLQPEPDVWTAYVAIAAALSIAALAVGSYGVSQWVLGGHPDVAVIGLPIVAVLGAGLYIASQIGQRLGRDQMRFLRSQLLEALEDLSPKLS
jgi:hypothetical protein